jgi:hypothetical protein
MSEIGKTGPATHIPLLVRVFDLSEGDVLEIGTGYFSTLILRWLAHMYKRHVYSYENNPNWYQKVIKGNTQYHTQILVDSWDKLPVDKHWGLVFIDHSPPARRIVEIERFAKRADYIVIHDTEPEHDSGYHFSKIWPLFKYVYHWKKLFQWTSVVSNFKDLKKLHG